MIWVVIALIYIAAGVSKWRHSGFEWTHSDTRRNFLISHFCHSPSPIRSSLGPPSNGAHSDDSRPLAACGTTFS